MLGQSGCISQYDELHSCPSDSHVHSSQVVQKSYLPFLIGADKTDENDIPLLPLKAIYRIHGDEAAERAQETASFDFASQILHLCLIR